MSEQDSSISLYLSMRKHLARAVSRIVPPKDVEDIVQETYVRLCQVEKKDDIRTPRSFLFKIARNLALDQVKRAESRLAIVSVDRDEKSGFYEHENLVDQTYAQVVSNEEFALFCEAVRHLPVQCRKAFVLRKVYGYSQREVADKLNLSESTVEKHIALGIKRCTYFMMQQTSNDFAPAGRAHPFQTDSEALL